MDITIFYSRFLELLFSIVMILVFVKFNMLFLGNFTYWAFSFIKGVRDFFLSTIIFITKTQSPFHFFTLEALKKPEASDRIHWYATMIYVLSLLCKQPRLKRSERAFDTRQKTLQHERTLIPLVKKLIQGLREKKRNLRRWFRTRVAWSTRSSCEQRFYGYGEKENKLVMKEMLKSWMRWK